MSLSSLYFSAFDQTWYCVSYHNFPLIMTHSRSWSYMNTVARRTLNFSVHVIPLLFHLVTMICTTVSHNFSQRPLQGSEAHGSWWSLPHSAFCLVLTTAIVARLLTIKMQLVWLVSLSLGLPNAYHLLGRYWKVPLLTNCSLAIGAYISLPSNTCFISIAVTICHMLSLLSTDFPIIAFRSPMTTTISFLHMLSNIHVVHEYTWTNLM